MPDRRRRRGKTTGAPVVWMALDFWAVLLYHRRRINPVNPTKSSQMNIERLEAVCDQLSSAISARVKYVNWGGCCLVAALVAKALRKLGYRADVVCMRSDWEAAYTDNPHANVTDIVRRSNDPRRWEYEGVWFSHVVVRVRVGPTYKFFDADVGLVSAHTLLRHWDHMSLMPGCMSPAQARKAYYALAWNDRFDHHNAPRVIRRLVRAFINRDNLL